MDKFLLEQQARCVKHCKVSLIGSVPIPAKKQATFWVFFFAVDVLESFYGFEVFVPFICPPSIFLTVAHPWNGELLFAVDKIDQTGTITSVFPYVSC